jgi:diguanylate cyclase
MNPPLDALYRTVVDKLGVGVMLLDSEYRIIFWNDFLARHSEIPEAEIMGKNLFEAFPYLSQKFLELKFRSLRMLRNYSFTSWRQRPYLLRFRPSRPVTSELEYMAQDCTFVPIFEGGAFFICIMIQDMTEASLTQGTLEETQDMNEMLQCMNTLDCLTGVLNRFQIERQIVHEFDRASRYGSNFAIGMIDLDHFKSINDQYGHLAGDDVLRTIARSLTEQVRAVDFVGRFGGEEFLFLLAETDDAGAMVVAERLRKHVEGLTIVHRDLKISVTTSIGVVGFRPGMKDCRQMMYLADIALYEAKKQGRNRIVLHQHECDHPQPPVQTT